MAQTEQVTVEVQAHIDNYVNNMKRATAFMKSAATVQGKAVNSISHMYLFQRKIGLNILR